MSMPAVVIECETCGVGGGSGKLWGDYAYIIDGAEVPLSRQLAWCHQCEALEPAERFEDIDACRQAVGALQASLSKTRWYQRCSASTRALQRQLQQAEATLKLLTLRGESPCCLRCGGREITPIEDWDQLEYDGNTGLYTGQARLRSRHPGCGGHFQVRPCGIRFAMRHTPQRYDIWGPGEAPDAPADRPPQ